jgi:hypothetical protein
VKGLERPGEDHSKDKPLYVQNAALPFAEKDLPPERFPRIAALYVIAVLDRGTPDTKVHFVEHDTKLVDAFRARHVPPLQDLLVTAVDAQRASASVVPYAPEKGPPGARPVTGRRRFQNL